MTDRGPFLIYATEGSLHYFASEDHVAEFLGHDYSGGNDWDDKDRAICASGLVFRISYDPQGGFYQLVATEEVWDYHKVQSLAEQCFKKVKRDPQVLRRIVESADEEDRIRLIMDSVNRLPEGPRWFVVVQWGCVLAFLGAFAGLIYGISRIASWLF